MLQFAQQHGSTACSQPDRFTEEATDSPGNVTFDLWHLTRYRSGYLIGRHKRLRTCVEKGKKEKSLSYKLLVLTVTLVLP